jgi:Arc/MetJ-type ribon-helix-helix transcriptional regulator
MVRTQIYLSETQKRALEQLAVATGQRQSELIRAAIDRFLAERHRRNWLKSLEPMFGMWADRPEMDDFVRGLRRETDERSAEKWEWVKS